MSVVQTRQQVDGIVAAFGKLAALTVDPSALPFHEVREDFERLEDSLAHKAAIDADFAWAAAGPSITLSRSSGFPARRR